MTDATADEKAPATDLERRASPAGVVSDEADQLAVLGYKPELQRNRSMFHLLFQTLAIAAIPYGEGGPLISAIYGGGPLSIVVGWIVVLVLDECVALSLSELASRYPTSAGVGFPPRELSLAADSGCSPTTGHSSFRPPRRRPFSPSSTAGPG